MATSECSRTTRIASRETLVSNVGPLAVVALGGGAGSVPVRVSTFHGLASHPEHRHSFAAALVKRLPGSEDLDGALGNDRQVSPGREHQAYGVPSRTESRQVHR